MKHTTEDLHEKFVLGYTINEISNETGIGKWALYKRFQRKKNAETMQEDDSKEDIIQENIVSNTDESQPRKSKWPDRIFVVSTLVVILTGFFLYRKYYSEKPYNETK